MVAVAAIALAPQGLQGGSGPGTTDPFRPFITSTVPSDGEMGVPLYSWIIVYFSEKMNSSNTIVRTDPPIDLTQVWLNSNWTLLLRHDTDFTPCTTYWVFADGTDAQGESLLVGPDSTVVPNPWTFTTACPFFAITRTDPADGDTGIAAGSSYEYGRAITVWFSRAADPATFQVTLSPSVPLEPVWSNGNTKVTLHHATWFRDCALHTVTVSAKDAGGNPLTNVTGSPPNPWMFTTVCIEPRILRTDPVDGAIDVSLFAPIVVSFSEPMDATTITASVQPPPGVTFDWNWTSQDTVLTLTHAVPFSKAMTFTVTITGNSSDGEALVPGPVPNPWSFNTSVLDPPPTNLHVARSPPDILLTWDPPLRAASYVVYASQDKFAPWPWPALGEVTTTWYRHRNADVDASSHYYIVRAKDPFGAESGNSTMGAKVPLSFTYDPGGTNVHWLSLPYRSMYRTARDIADQLTSANIDVVGKWNSAGQRSILWYFLRGEWRGTDFSLGPGDAFYIGTVATFTWIVNGTDGPIGRGFTYFPPPSDNTHWVSLPYTSSYRVASEIVMDIEGGTGPTANRWIVELARWDSSAQQLVRFTWTPSGWDGTDFAIIAGEGVNVRVASSFSWTPRLITPEVP